jgi:hypothetical protein
MRTVLVVVATLLMAGPTPAADPPKSAEAIKAIKEQLEKLNARPVEPRAIEDAVVGKAVPGHLFFAVIFPQFPVAIAPPEPLQSSNLFAVGPGGKAVALPSARKLFAYLAGASAPGKDEDVMKELARAWARLAVEYHQDGYYEFKHADEATRADRAGKKAVAKMVASKGGNGEVQFELTFTGDGRLSGWKETARLVPGIRPRCQATLLLHPDPLVRQIVEQDLLVMGRPAHAYLMEQRAKATPELQRAIDRIWQRIVDEDR